MAVQLKYNRAMKRYDVLLPFTLADESSEVVVASISEDEKLTLHRELKLSVVKQIILRWDEKVCMQLERDLREKSWSMRETEEFINKRMKGDK